jgi:hypothetical protein
LFYFLSLTPKSKDFTSKTDSFYDRNKQQMVGGGQPDGLGGKIGKGLA